MIPGQPLEIQNATVLAIEKPPNDVGEFVSNDFHKRDISKPEDYQMMSTTNIKQMKGQIDSVWHELYFFLKNFKEQFFPWTTGPVQTICFI